MKIKKIELTEKEVELEDKNQMKHIASLGKHGAGKNDKLLKRMIERLTEKAQTLNCGQCTNYCQSPHLCRTSVIVRRPSLGIAKGGFILEVRTADKRQNTVISFAEFIRSKVHNAKIESCTQGRSKDYRHFTVFFTLPNRRKK